MLTKTLVSAGGIVYKKNKLIEIAVAETMGGRVFSLPKGIIEPNETPEQAAIREVKEETNLKAKVIDKIGVIDYWFVWQGVRYHKFVHFFLMKYLSGEPKPLDEELDAVYWMNIQEVLKKLTYKGEREMVLKGEKWLNKQMKHAELRRRKYGA